MAKKYDLTEAGLEFGLIFADYCWKTQFLHYGFFKDGMEALPENVAQAQENYTQFLFSQFPEGVKTILDVGCGTGALTKRLLDEGYQVDCVSPGDYLTSKVRAKLGDRAEIFNSGFEDVETDKRYDLIMFSESFQYIPVQDAISQGLKFLNPDGHIVICDFFKRTEEKSKSPIGGGHDQDEFFATMKNFKVTEIKNQDITAETAPSLDVVDDFLTRFMIPITEIIIRVTEHKAPWLIKLIKWKFAAKLAKASYKYYNRNINAASFAKHKCYRLLLYKKDA